MKYAYTHFINENIAPKGATRFVVMKMDENDNPVKEVTSITASRFGCMTHPASEPDYSVGWVSDCHTFKTETVADGNWKGNAKLKNALNYFVECGCIMVIGCGDFTQTGFYLNNKDDYNESQMLNYKAIIDQCPIPIFEIFGNHENYNGRNITDNLTRAKELTRIPATAYTVSSNPDSDEIDGTTVRPNRYAPVGDDLYILCGQSTSGHVMSEDDFAWLGNTLGAAANKHRRCFTVVHSYMEGDSGDADDRRENSIFDSWPKTTDFVALLSQYLNAILFHGHSHMKFEHQAVDPLANYATIKGYKSVHVPSLGMPRDIDPNAAANKDTPEDHNASQCYRVDVYRDFIVLNGLSFSGEKATPVPLGTYKIEV